MAETRKRRGVKPRVAAPGERRALGLMVTPEVKNKLDAAARLNGRSQSQEAEARLEQTFRNENYLDQAMDLAFGPRLAVLLAAMGRAMNETGRLAEFRTDWMSVPALFNEAVGAADEVLESFRPSDDDVARRDPPLRGIAIGRVVMGAICDPNRNIVPFKEWAAALYAKLGADAAAHLNVAPWDVAVSTENIVQTDRFTMQRKQERGTDDRQHHPPRRP